jgi:hypothetical protein
MADESQEFKCAHFYCQVDNRIAPVGGIFDRKSPHQGGFAGTRLTGDQDRARLSLEDSGPKGAECTSTAVNHVERATVIAAIAD